MPKFLAYSYLYHCHTYYFNVEHNIQGLHVYSIAQNNDTFLYY